MCQAIYFFCITHLLNGREVTLLRQIIFTIPDKRQANNLKRTLVSPVTKFVANPSGCLRSGLGEKLDQGVGIWQRNNTKKIQFTSAK